MGKKANGNMQDAEEYCIDDETSEEETKARPIIKNAMDLQRLKLEKLMKNPDKPIVIPEQPKEKDFMHTVPTFVRNVMGSSAGAGSGEFHVYRHLRRKEYARQKYIQAKSVREQMDDDYRQKLEQNRLEAEAKTAKRRAKRLKKKQKIKQKGKRRKEESDSQQFTNRLSESSESSDEQIDTDEGKELSEIVSENDTAESESGCNQKSSQGFEVSTEGIISEGESVAKLTKENKQTVPEPEKLSGNITYRGDTPAENTKEISETPSQGPQDSSPAPELLSEDKKVVEIIVKSIQAEKESEKLLEDTAYVGDRPPEKTEKNILGPSQGPQELSEKKSDKDRKEKHAPQNKQTELLHP